MLQATTGHYGRRYRWNKSKKMAKLDKEELEKLTPSERIKKLKKLEEENRKEIEEAEKLIKKTEADIERENIAESVKVPDTKPIDIESLFKEGPGLESTVKEGAPIKETEAEGPLYQLAQAYEEARGLLYSNETLNENQLEWIDKLGERVEKMKYQTESDQIANLAVATKSIVQKLKRYHTQ